MGKNEEIIRLENELDSARKSGDDKKSTALLEEIIYYYSHSEFLLKSIPFAQELSILLLKSNDKKKLANTYDFLGRMFTFKPDYDQAGKFARSALQLFEELGDESGKAQSYLNLGGISRIWGKFDESLEFMFKAKEIMELQLRKKDLENFDNLSKNYTIVLDRIGLIYGKLKQMEQSREYIQMALQKSKELNYTDGIFKGLINLGVSYSEEDSEKTLQYYLEALPHVRERGKTHVLAIVKNNIGGVYEDRGEFDKALEYYHKALDLTKDGKLSKDRTFILKHIGSVLFKQGKYDEALEYVNKSMEDARQKKQKQEIENNFLLMSNIYKAQKKYKKSLINYESYSELKDKRLNSEVIDKISNLQKKYEDTRKKLVNTQRKSSLISEVLREQMSMNFIGKSNAIKEVHELAMMAAEHRDTNVLITGESGTGKEIIAHIIHFASDRKDNMFIPVNCSSIPESLMESEFFGHKKGSFTGAISDKTGYLEDARNGTLFLDEIGDMSAQLQAKLLRVLESKKIKPIGSSKEIQVDFRIIAATNQDIKALIGENIFRVDLFYRINTIEIHIPPLRERKSDIEPLVHYFISHFAKVLKKPMPKIGYELIEHLENHYFPGNVRELRNMIERAMIMLKTDTLTLECFDLVCAPVNNTVAAKPKVKTLDEMEKEMIIAAMDKTGNNHSRAALLLGISYSTLNRKLKQINNKA